MGNSESAHGRPGSDEEVEAEASFQAYIRPVELYNRFHQRSLRHPYFLRRTLSYRAATPLTETRGFELGLSIDDERRRSAPTVFAALCHIRPGDSADAADVSQYCVKRAWRLQAAPGSDKADGARVLLMLPAGLPRDESTHLAFFLWEGHDKARCIGRARGAPVSNGLRGGRVFGLVPVGSNVLWCATPIAPFLAGADARVDAAALNNGHLALSRAVLQCSTDAATPAHACQLRFEPLAAEPQLTLLHFAAASVYRPEPPLLPDAAHVAERTADPGTSSRDVSPYPGRVWFHFLYHHNMRRRSEVTEHSSCPFCMLACASFQGLQEHLQASHDKFSYTFSAPASALPTVNVSCWSSAASASTALSRNVSTAIAKEFCFHSRRYGIVLPPTILRPSADVGGAKRKLADAVWPEEGNSDDSAAEASAASKVARTGHVVKRGTQAAPLTDAVLARGRMLTRTRPPPKPPKPVAAVQAPSVADHAAAGKFFHARTAVTLQPKELEDGCNDSDDDVDEQYWEAKCRRGIDEFGDVTQVEKDFMFMWNVFVHRRHIFSDQLLGDAAIEFAQANRRELAADSELRRCFTLHLINLWDASLLDGAAMDGALRKLEPAAAASGVGA